MSLLNTFTPLAPNPPASPKMNCGLAFGAYAAVLDDILQFWSTYCHYRRTLALSYRLFRQGVESLLSLNSFFSANTPANANSAPHQTLTRGYQLTGRDKQSGATDRSQKCRGKVLATAKGLLDGTWIFRHNPTLFYINFIEVAQWKRNLRLRQLLVVTVVWRIG